MSGLFVWLPWPAAVLTVNRDEARLRSIVGGTRVGRDEVERVHLRKRLSRWELRFEGHGRGFGPGLVFVPLASQPVVEDLRELGWTVDEDQPDLRGVF